MSTVSQTNVNYNELLESGNLSFIENEVNVISYTYNLVNIIPNPLYNNYLNDVYDNKSYITSDLDGITNTAYLKHSKNNIANKLENNMYIPSIGELGIAIENINKINSKISYLNIPISYSNNYFSYLNTHQSDIKYSYASYYSYISYNTVIPSSSLYSSQNIKNSYYVIENNIDNVWCINTANGEISYKPTSVQFNIIPFFMYKPGSENNNSYSGNNNSNDPIPENVLTYIVTWRINYSDGTDPNVSVVIAGNSLNAPVNIFREGYTYTWNTQENGNGEDITFPYTPSADITLYAKWTIRTYIVTFKITDSVYEFNNILINPIEYTYNSIIGELPIAYDNNNQYANTNRWKIEGTNTEVFSNTRVINNMTLVPIKRIVSEYTIKWYTRADNIQNHGYYRHDQIDNINYFDNGYYQDSYSYGDNLILPEKYPIRNDEDYIFDGWADYSGPIENIINGMLIRRQWKPNISSNYQVQNSATFYAVYKPSISWYYFDNDIYQKNYGYYNDNALNYKPNDPSRDRYRFIGWNSYPNQREADNDNEIIIKNPASNKIYAVWYYSVKWNGNKDLVNTQYGDIENGNYTGYYYQDNYLYGDSLVYPQDNPIETPPILNPNTLNRYNFGGWSTSRIPTNNNFDNNFTDDKIWKPDIPNNYIITESIEFYAIWKPAIYWYNYDGTEILFVTYGYFNDYIKNYQPELSVYLSRTNRTNYTFKGWNTETSKTTDNVSTSNIKIHWLGSENKFYAAYEINT